MPQQLQASLQRACITCKGTCGQTIAPWRLSARCARGKTTLLRRGPLRMWLALRLCGPPLRHCELTLNLCRPSYNQSISAWSSTSNDTHSTPDPWAPWDVRFRCSSLQQADPPGQRTLRKGSTSAPLLTAWQHRVWVTSRAERTVQTLVGSPRGT
jgi:hypothetical protein